MIDVSFLGLHVLVQGTTDQEGDTDIADAVGHRDIVCVGGGVAVDPDSCSAVIQGTIADDEALAPLAISFFEVAGDGVITGGEIAVVHNAIVTAAVEVDPVCVLVTLRRHHLAALHLDPTATVEADAVGRRIINVEVVEEYPIYGEAGSP